MISERSPVRSAPPSFKCHHGSEPQVLQDIHDLYEGTEMANSAPVERILTRTRMFPFRKLESWHPARVVTSAQIHTTLAKQVQANICIDAPELTTNPRSSGFHEEGASITHASAGE